MTESKAEITDSTMRICKICNMDVPKEEYDAHYLGHARDPLQIELLQSANDRKCASDATQSRWDRDTNLGNARSIERGFAFWANNNPKTTNVQGTNCCYLEATQDEFTIKFPQDIDPIVKSAISRVTARARKARWMVKGDDIVPEKSYDWQKITIGYRRSGDEDAEYDVPDLS